MKDESKNNGGKKNVSLNAYLGFSETFCRDSWLCNELCRQTAIYQSNWGGRVFNAAPQLTRPQLGR